MSTPEWIGDLQMPMERSERSRRTAGAVKTPLMGRKSPLRSPAPARRGTSVDESGQQAPLRKTLSLQPEENGGSPRVASLEASRARLEEQRRSTGEERPRASSSSRFGASQESLKKEGGFLGHIRSIRASFKDLLPGSSGAEPTPGLSASQSVYDKLSPRILHRANTAGMSGGAGDGMEEES